MQPYWTMSNFEGLYLEDSYVLGISEADGEVRFKMDIILRETHPEYKKPRHGEIYCYAPAEIIFKNVRNVRWIRNIMMKYTDKDGTVDYGNIDSMYVNRDNNRFDIEGDWGRLVIESDWPEVVIN